MKDQKYRNLLSDSITWFSFICTPFPPCFGTPSTTTYNLRIDWSDSNKPNCAWSYREGENPLPHVDWWHRNLGGYQRPQSGWARGEDSSSRLPFWNQSIGAEAFRHDWEIGDIVRVSIAVSVTQISPRHEIGIQRSRQEVIIHFSGVLQKTADLLTWDDLTPRPCSPFIFTPNFPRMFFRARED